MLEREEQAQKALVGRLNDTITTLGNERRVADYLRETGRDGAAKRSEEIIQKLEKSIAKYQSELGFPEL